MTPRKNRIMRAAGIEGQSGQGRDASQIGRAAVRGPGPIRPLPDFKPFPVGSLPEAIGRFVREASLAINCDPCYLALPALAALAVAIGRSRVASLKQGWDEPAVVWAVVVGDSGTMKSPAWKQALAPLHRIQGEWMREDQDAREQYEEEREAWERARKNAGATGTKPPPRPEKPPRRQFIASDITIERLAELIQDYPRGVLVTRDELAGWLNSFTRYSSSKHGGGDMPAWLELHQAGILQYDRKADDRRSIRVPGATASVTGGIQPGVLARVLQGEHLDAGLAARCLFAMPDRRPKVWTQAEVSPEAERGYEDLLRGLFTLSGKHHGGDLLPIRVPFSPGAMALWGTFYNEWGRLQSDASGPEASALAKLEAYAARFALLHGIAEQATWSRNGCTEPIGEESLQAGIDLARWFKQENARVYAMLSSTQDEQESQRLVEWVRRRGGSTTARQLQRAQGTRYPTKQHAHAALDTLVAGGLACWEESPDGQTGRPTSYLVLLPPPDTSDTTDDNAAG